MEFKDARGTAIWPGDAIKTTIINPVRHGLKDGSKVIGYVREMYQPPHPIHPIRGRVAFAVMGGQVTEYFNISEAEVILRADGTEPEA